MGEATYFGKIRFKSIEEAEKAFPFVLDLIKDTYKAGEYWQANRHKEDKDAFWKGMEVEFPLASDYLKSIKPQYMGPIWGGDHNNGLAGLLDLIGWDGDAEYIERRDEDICWASTVWHFADWEPFVEYIESKYDCEMHWLSDEYMDYDALLELEFKDE